MRVTLVIPVFNEVRQLAASIRQLTGVLRGLPGWTWTVVIADNASTDGTWECAQRLAGSLPVRAIRVARKGRGGALRTVWLAADTEVLAYMDVDLSTNLRHLPELLEPLKRHEADLVIGSRLAAGASVQRGWTREVLSRGYNHLTRWLTGSRLRDHQCGFKAIHRSAAQALLPRVRDAGWFFDTELLVLAQRDGWRIVELPVQWIDDPDSRVRLAPTILRNLVGLWRLRCRPLPRDSGPSRSRRVFT